MKPATSQERIVVMAVNIRGQGNCTDDINPKGVEYMFHDPNESHERSRVLLTLDQSVQACFIIWISQRHSQFLPHATTDNLSVPTLVKRNDRSGRQRYEPRLRRSQDFGEFCIKNTPPYRCSV